MKILRIDDRLIHGQVIIGWIGNQSIDNLFLFYEDLPEYVISIYKNMLDNLEEFHAINLRENFIYKENKKNTIFIIKDIVTLYKYMYKIKIIKPDLINLGGLRITSNKKKILDFIYMSSDDINKLIEIKNVFNCKINAQELPYSKDYNIIEIISQSF